MLVIKGDDREDQAENLWRATRIGRTSRRIVGSMEVAARRLLRLAAPHTSFAPRRALSRTAQGGIRASAVISRPIITWDHLPLPSVTLRRAPRPRLRNSSYTFAWTKRRLGATGTWRRC